MFKIIIAIIATTVVVLIAMAVVDKTTGAIVSSTPTTTSSASATDSLQVTVTGEVNHTGTYVLALQSTLKDLLEAAGGATSNADPKAYDVTYVLKNKASFYIAPIYNNGNTCAVTPIEKVCVNSATKEELNDRVSAFSSSVAGAVVAYRQEKGSFKALEELKNVNGVGPATFEKCKDYVTLTD